MPFRTIPIAHCCNLVVASLAERVAQPFEAFVEPITGSCACRLDVLEHISHRYGRWGQATYPGTLAETVQAKLVSDLSSIHGVL